MKAYYSFFRMRLINSLQYRAAALGGIACTTAWALMNILLYKAFYQANPDAFPMGFSQLTSYIWLQQALLPLFMLRQWDLDVFQEITDGNISYTLVRPLDLYHTWFIKNIASRLSRTMLQCPLLLLLGFCIAKPYRLAPPQDGVSLLMFFITACFSLAIVTAVCLLVYISTFYTLSSQGQRLVVSSLSDFLTGSLIPLPFLPNAVVQIISLTPFYFMQNLPLRVYSGNISGTELYLDLLLQIAWLVGLILLGKWWLKRASRKIIVQGG